MLHVRAVVLAALSIAVAVAPLATGSGLLPVSPVLNGGFEHRVEGDGGGGYFDGALWWAEGYGSNARFEDADGDGDVEAVVPANVHASTHNFWQSTMPPLQAVTANFDWFEFTLESGAIPPAANVQIGFALTPAYEQHPWVGIWWEGAVLFRAADLAPSPTGRVAVNPVAHGEIICPDWDDCRAFKADYDAADAAGKAALLGQARIVQVSFWGLNSAAAGQVVVDDVAILGATTVAEEAAVGNVNLP